MVEGIPQSETGYLYNPRNPIYGPPAYPVGFPLLLSPVFAIAGNSVKAFNYEISFLFFVFVLLSYVFFRKSFSPFSSFILALIMAYNPWLLSSKSEINSDIPFALFALIVIILYKSSKRNFLNAMTIGLLCGFAFSIRLIGAALIIAIIIDQLYRWVKKDLAFSKTFLLLIPVFASGFFLLLNLLIFRLPEGFFFGAASIFSVQELSDTFLANLNIYFEILRNLFYTGNENEFRSVSVLFMSCLLCFTLLGLIVRIKGKITLSEIFFMVYIAIILFYPYPHAGFRFLIPVLPIVWAFSADAMRFIINALEIRRKNILVVVTAILFYLIYKYDLKKILESQYRVISGPYQFNSKEAFEKIRNITKPDDRILFNKPRALALFTGNTCFANNPLDNSSVIKNQIKEFDVDYILINSEISDEAIKLFVTNNSALLIEIWQNEIYRLYKIRKQTYGE